MGTNGLVGAFWRARLHVAYLIGAIILASATFFLGRYTGQGASLKAMAADPNFNEAAKAVNALNSWTEALGGNAKKKEEDIKELKVAVPGATDTTQNDDVRIHIDGVYRGQLEHGDNMGKFDGLGICYTLQNLSKTSLLDVEVSDKVVDNFGNESEKPMFVDMDSLSKCFNLDNLPNVTNHTDDKIGPGESKREFAAFTKPLANANWYGIKMKVIKADGSESGPVYLKAMNRSSGNDGIAIPIPPAP